MPRVEIASIRVDQIICKNHLISSIHPVEWEIVAGLQVTTHAEEPCEVMVHGIVERGRVERILALLAEEKLVLAFLSCKIHRCRKVFRLLIRLSAAAIVDGTESVAGRELAREKEVFLANLGCAVAHGGGEVSLGVYRHLGGFIEPKSVDVEHGDHHARKCLEALAYRGHPFPETVLDRGKFCYLPLIVWMNTKGLCIAILVKVRIITALKLFALCVINQEACLVPEPRVFARVIVVIAEIEIMVLPAGLVRDLVFICFKRGGIIQVTVEA